MVRGQCRNEWPQRESRLRGHPDGRRSPQSDGRAGDREGDRVRLRWLHTRGPRALLTPARRPRGGGRRAARQRGSRRSTARPEPRLRMRPSPKWSISQGHHEAQGEGGGQLNKTVSNRGGAKRSRLCCGQGVQQSSWGHCGPRGSFPRRERHHLWGPSSAAPASC